MTSLKDWKYAVDYKLNLKRIFDVDSHLGSPEDAIKQN